MFRRLFFSATLASVVTAISVVNATAAPLIPGPTTLVFDSKFYGPSVNNFSSFRPNLDTGAEDPKAAVKTEDKLTLGYGLSEFASTGVAIEADFYPVNGTQFTWKDPSVFFKLKNALSYDYFATAVTAKLYPGMSDVSKAKHQIVALRLEQDTFFQLPDKRARFEVYNYIQPVLYSETDAKTKNMKVLLALGPEYRFSPNLVVNATYRNWLYHLNNASALSLGSELALLNFGAVWKMLPSVALNPWMDLSVGNRVMLSTTTVGLGLTWTAL